MSFDDAPERTVMICSVVKLAAATALRKAQRTCRRVGRTLALTPDHDTARATVIDARGGYGVFAVMAARRRRQQLLVIAEGDAIAIVRKRTAAADQLQRLMRLGRKRLQTHIAQLLGIATRKSCRGKKRSRQQQQMLCSVPQVSVRRETGYGLPAVTPPAWYCAAGCAIRGAGARAPHSALQPSNPDHAVFSGRR